MISMKKGEVWWVELADAQGHEQRGERPVVVMGRANGMIVAVPMTTNTDRAILSHTLVLEPTKENGLSEDSVVLVFHIRALDKTRLKRKIGEITKEETDMLDALTADLLGLAKK